MQKCGDLEQMTYVDVDSDGFHQGLRVLTAVAFTPRLEAEADAVVLTPPAPASSLSAFVRTLEDGVSELSCIEAAPSALEEAPESSERESRGRGVKRRKVSQTACEYVNPETGKQCGARVISKRKCARHGGGKRCTFVSLSGVACTSRAHAQGKCALHGGSRCTTNGCNRHYVLDLLCTSCFILSHNDNADQMLRLRTRQKKKKKVEV